MNDCIFCKILAGEIPSVRVHEGPNCVAFLDVNPMAKGHVLVVPRRHWADLASVPVSEAGDVAAFSELMHTVRAIAKAAIRAGWDGANVLQCTGESAGQTVGHLHFHVIPRRRRARRRAPPPRRRARPRRAPRGRGGRAPGCASR